MRHLATIREIASLRPIAGADRIEVAQVDGWECVVQKGEFHTGEHIVYIEVDSIVPERPEFEFLRDRKFRVRTIKLRGQVSQGLVLPLSILPNGTPAILGADVTDALGIKKYDPEAQQEAQLLTKQPQKPQSAIARFLMRFKWYRKLFMKPKRKGGFPDWIAKTDETRIQNLTTLFEMERNKGTKFSVTEKVDGQSATYYLRKVSKRKYEFGVCSRNIYLGTPDNSSYWTIARQLHIEDVLKHLVGDYETIVLQGEICPRVCRLCCCCGMQLHADGSLHIVQRADDGLCAEPNARRTGGQGDLLPAGAVHVRAAHRPSHVRRAVRTMPGMARRMRCLRRVGARCPGVSCCVPQPALTYTAGLGDRPPTLCYNAYKDFDIRAERLLGKRVKET